MPGPVLPDPPSFDVGCSGTEAADTNMQGRTRSPAWAKRTRLRHTLAGIASMLAFAYLAAEIVIAVGWKSDYSFRHDTISDLGVTACTPIMCSPLHLLMNATFVSGLTGGGSRTPSAGDQTLIDIGSGGRAAAPWRLPVRTPGFRRHRQRPPHHRQKATKPTLRIGGIEHNAPSKPPASRVSSHARSHLLHQGNSVPKKPCTRTTSDARLTSTTLPRSIISEMAGLRTICMSVVESPPAHDDRAGLEFGDRW